MLTTLNHRMPGVTAERTATPRRLDVKDAVYIGGIIDGTATRDAGNSPVHELRAGKLMGQITSSKKWAPSIIGLTSAAFAGGDNHIHVAAGVGTEVARRIGTSGTLTLIGPHADSGVVRAKKIAFTGITSDTEIAVTIPGRAAVNAVHTTTFNAAWTAGTLYLAIWNFQLQQWDWFKWTWHTDFATSLADLNTDLNTRYGSGVIVASGTATAPVITFTLAPYAGMNWPEIMWDVSDATGPATWSTACRPFGHSDGFATKSIVAATDGSEYPKAVFTGVDGYPLRVVDEDGVSRDCSYDRLLVASHEFVPSQLVDWPNDISLRAWIKAQLRASGPWVFNDLFV